MNNAAPRPSNVETRRQEAERDRELVHRARSGDKGAFRLLVERHERRAYNIAFAIVRNENDARDIVQDAFLRVYRSLETFHDGASFFTWFFRIVTNLAIDQTRKGGRSEELGDEVPEDGPYLPMVSRIEGADPLQSLARRELGERLQRALDRLPPIHRGVLVMRELEGMSYEEMADAMGVSQGTIMSRLFKARQKMQRALADCYAQLSGAEDDAAERRHPR